MAPVDVHKASKDQIALQGAQTVASVHIFYTDFKGLFEVGFQHLLCALSPLLHHHLLSTPLTEVYSLQEQCART